MTWYSTDQSKTNLGTIDIGCFYKSGFPWFYPLFGTLEEHIMAKSSDPVISAVWDGKEDVNKVSQIETLRRNFIVLYYIVFVLNLYLNYE